MTPEERFERIEQKIEFIVDQQAQFSIGLQQLRETQAVMQGQIDKLKDAVVAMITMIGDLADGQKKLTEAQARMDAKIAELAAKGAETEGRLNIFISVVERYISQQRDDSKPAED
jgi:chromosome segregation ATPase